MCSVRGPAHAARWIALVLVFGAVSSAPAADSRSRCDAATLSAASAAAADLMRCQASASPQSCALRVQAAFERALLKARKTRCSSQADASEFWAATTTVVEGIASLLSSSVAVRSKCGQKRIDTAADGIRLRAAPHAKARKRYSPEGFARSLSSSAVTIAERLRSAQNVRDCPSTLALDDVVNAVDAGVQRLLERSYGCEIAIPSEVGSAAGGKWQLLLGHAAELGYPSVASGILCPPRRAEDEVEPPVMIQATLESPEGDTIVAGNYPDIGVAMLLRGNADGGTTVFHWLGGVRVARDGSLAAVDENGDELTNLDSERAGLGLFDACQEAHKEAIRCWVRFCRDNIQNAASCNQLRRCIGLQLPPAPPELLTDPLGCIAAFQALSGAPCPKPGQFLSCDFPGDDDECRLSGVCNILDVCRPDGEQYSDGQSCSPDRPGLGPRTPYCLDDRKLVRTVCDRGRCTLRKKPILCATACCGAPGSAHCNDAPGSCGPVCGNGLTTPPEECDDENTLDGDGCSSECRNECAALPSDAVVFWQLSPGQYVYANNGSDETKLFTDGVQSSIATSREWQSTANDECRGSGVLRASSSAQLTSNGNTSDLRANLRVERHWCVPGEAPAAGISVNTGFMVGVPPDSPNRSMRIPYVASYEWTVAPGDCLPYGIPESLTGAGASAFQAGGDYPCPGRPDLVCPQRFTVFGELGLTARLSAGLASAHAVVTDCTASAIGHYTVRMCPDRAPQ